MWTTKALSGLNFRTFWASKWIIQSLTPTTSPRSLLLLSSPSSLFSPQNPFLSAQVRELRFSFVPAPGSPGFSLERPLERVRAREAAEGKAGAAAEQKSVQPSLLHQTQHIKERLHLLPLLFLKTRCFTHAHTYSKSMWDNSCRRHSIRRSSYMYLVWFWQNSSLSPTSEWQQTTYCRLLSRWRDKSNSKSWPFFSETPLSVFLFAGGCL